MRNASVRGARAEQSAAEAAADKAKREAIAKPRSGFEAAAERLSPKGVKFAKFRADRDEKEWAKENLSLNSFPTLLLFPKGRSGYVKLGSERRDPDSLQIFIESILGKL